MHRKRTMRGRSMQVKLRSVRLRPNSHFVPPDDDPRHYLNGLWSKMSSPKVREKLHNLEPLGPLVAHVSNKRS